MFGIAKEDRLGVYIEQLENQKEREKSMNQESKLHQEMIIKGLTLVDFINPKIQATKVECGSSFTLVLTSQGHLYSWGFGKSGSLGLGEKSVA